MKKQITKRINLCKVQINVQQNASVEFEENEDYNQRVIIRSDKFFSRDSFTPSQLQSIKMLKQLNAYFLIYL